MCELGKCVLRMVVSGLSREKVPRFKRELHQIPSHALADLVFYKSGCSKNGNLVHPPKTPPPKTLVRN